MKASKFIGHLAALFVVMVWGETFVSSKVLLNEGLMPADIFFYRFILAYICIWIPSHKRFFSKSIADEITLMFMGIMGGSVYFLTENMALKYSMASNVSILVSSTPLITALLISLFYKNERLSMWQLVGSIVAFLGMAMVVLNGQLVLHLNPRGDALALGAALSWGFYSLLMKRVMGHYDTRFITRKVFFYGILSIIPYYIMVHPLNTSLEILSKPVVWGNLVYLGLVASMLCYAIWNWAMSKLGAVRSTNYLYLQSLFTMVVAVIILNEHITWMAIAGAIILILGMIRASKAHFF